MKIQREKIQIQILEKSLTKIEGVVDSYTPESLRREKAFEEVENLLKDI